MRVTSLGWCVEGHVPAELEAALRRLHDDLYEQHGDEATEGLQFTREPGRGSAQIFVALHDFDIAVRFAQAVNALVEKTPREADDAA